MKATHLNDNQARTLPRARFDELRQKIQLGIDQLNRGDGAAWSAEEIMAEGRALLAARRKVAGK